MFTYQSGACDGSPAYAATSAHGRSMTLAVSTSTAMALILLHAGGQKSKNGPGTSAAADHPPAPVGGQRTDTDLECRRPGHRARPAQAAFPARNRTAVNPTGVAACHGRRGRRRHQTVGAR